MSGKLLLCIPATHTASADSPRARIMHHGKQTMVHALTMCQHRAAMSSATLSRSSTHSRLPPTLHGALCCAIERLLITAVDAVQCSRHRAAHLQDRSERKRVLGGATPRRASSVVDVPCTRHVRTTLLCACDDTAPAQPAERQGGGLGCPLGKHDRDTLGGMEHVLPSYTIWELHPELRVAAAPKMRVA